MIKFTLFALAAALLFAGCKKSEMPVKAPPASSQAGAIKTEPDSVVEDFIPDTGNYGTVTQCPVMGEKVIVGKDTKAVKYKGRVYFLCCPSCEAQFKQNPEKYTNQK